MQRPDKTSQTLLASIALLRVERENNRDYVQLLVPFAQELLAILNPEIVTSQFLRKNMQDAYGLVIPDSVCELVLKRLVKKKILVKEAHSFFATGDLQPTGFYNSVLAKEKELDRTLEAIVAFARDVHSIEWTKEKTSDVLTAYMRQFSIDCLAYFVSASALPAIPASNKDFVLVSEFIEYSMKTNLPASGAIRTLVKGSMLANALLCPDLDAFTKDFDEVQFFIDTPIILRALGFNSEESEHEAKLLFTMLRDLGGILRVFDHTLEETESLLRSTIDSYDNSGKNYMLNSWAKRRGYGKADIEVMLSKLPLMLRNLYLTVVPRPNQAIPIAFTEDDIESVVRAKVGQVFDKTIYYDVLSVRSIVILRRAVTPYHLEDSKAVLVTSNATLAKSMFELCSSVPSCARVSPVISNFSLANLAWLKRPATADIPDLNLAIACESALEPSDAYWREFLREAELLEARGQISAVDLQALRADPVARKELMHLTLGEDKTLGAQTYKDIVESVKRHYTQEKDVELQAERERRALGEEELFEARKKLEGIRVAHLTRVSGRSAAIAASYAATLTTLVYGSIVLLVLGGAVLWTVRSAMAFGIAVAISLGTGLLTALTRISKVPYAAEFYETRRANAYIKLMAIAHDRLPSELKDVTSLGIVNSSTSEGK